MRTLLRDSSWTLVSINLSSFTSSPPLPLFQGFLRLRPDEVRILWLLDATPTFVG